MKLATHITAEKGKELVKTANVSINMVLTNNKKQEYTICYNTSGLQVYKTVNNKGADYLILDTINKTVN